MKFKLTLLILLGVSGWALAAQADTGPQIWVTWRAATFIPAAYSGRALPVENSKVVAAVDVVSGGRTADLGSQTVYWYLNDNFLSGGQGATRATFTVPGGAATGGLSLRVSLPDYLGGVSKTVMVPVAEPQVFLSGPLRTKSSEFAVQAVPFYFSVGDMSALSFAWTVAGQDTPPEGKPDVMHISLDKSVAAGSSIPVSVSVQNPAGLLEQNSAQISVQYQP